jgi:hypothetical protein
LSLRNFGLPLERIVEGLQSEFRVTLRLAVYRQSVRLGDKPLEDHDQTELTGCVNLTYVVGHERTLLYFSVSCLFHEY